MRLLVMLKAPQAPPGRDGGHKRYLQFPTFRRQRAQRSAANKRLYAQIQGQKGNITRAAKAGDKDAFVAAVQQADSLCPATWETEKARIKAKATEQAKVLNKVLAAV